MLLVLFVYSVILALAHGMNVEVQTNYGTVRGYTSATHNIWKGIPYATPPTGDLRWKLPLEPKTWSGVLNTTIKSAACPQPGVSYKISEDCLYLNIFSPINADPSSNLPVYIFVHGGSFWGGSGGDVNGEYLSATDIVVVAINYRLGAFGYLALPELLKNSSEHTYGFYGIQDQRASFKWVKENIKAFGGDPTRITIGGQSAGAISVCLHVAALRSGGLFERGIMESGTCVVNTPVQSEAASNMLVKKLNCDTAPDVVQCLISKTTDEIVAATAGPIWPCPNEYEMDKQPIDMLREGKFNKVDLLIGTNHDEQSFESCPWFGNINATEYVPTLGKVYGSRLAELVSKVYPVTDYVRPVAGITEAWSDSRFHCPTLNMAEAIAPAQSQPVYLYSFDHVSSWQKNTCENVTHSSELAYIYPGSGVFNAGTPQEKLLSKTFLEFWSSFIAEGTPRSSTSGVSWTRFSNDTQQYLSIDVPAVHMEPHFRQSKCQFWDNYIP